MKEFMVGVYLIGSNYFEVPPKQYYNVNAGCTFIDNPIDMGEYEFLIINIYFLAICYVFSCPKEKVH